MQRKAEHPGRILVIDDEPSVRSLLDRVLTAAGHQVTLVENGEEALQRLAQGAFELVIADKNLPGIGGIDVVRMARSQHPSLQAILITAYPTPDDEQEAKRLGVVAFVTKPFGILEMIGTCDEAIRRTRNEPALRGATA